MKKSFFAFIITSIVILSACNNKPAEKTEVTSVDSSLVTTTADTTTATTATDTTVAK